jgi:hypothetical protein
MLQASLQGNRRILQGLDRREEARMRIPKRLAAAAKQGNAEAQYSLAATYAGELRDFESAVYWYKRAAAKRHPEATYNLAFMLILGEGVEKDVNRGLALMKTAADLGSLDAQLFIADALLYGYWGQTKDKLEAAFYYVLSVRCGNTKAALSLGEALRRKRISTAAVSEALIRVAAAGGQKDAMEMLKASTSAPLPQVVLRRPPIITTARRR